MKRLAENGFALPYVISIVAVVAIVAVWFSTASWGERQLSAVRLDQSQASQLAEAGVSAGIAWVAAARRDENLWTHFDGRWHELSFSGRRISFSVTPTQGLINLNGAPERVLESLLLNLGMDDADSEVIAREISSLRGGTTNRDSSAGNRSEPGFTTVAQLIRSDRIGKDVYMQLEPYVTVHSAGGRTDPLMAPEIVLKALTRASRGSSQAPAELGKRASAVRIRLDDAPEVFRIHAKAELPGGLVCEKRAVVWLPVDEGSKFWTIDVLPVFPHDLCG